MNKKCCQTARQPTILGPMNRLANSINLSSQDVRTVLGLTRKDNEGLILEFGKLDFKRHEAGRTKVCAAMDVMPVPRYSSNNGKYPLLLHFASTSHEANVSYHYIKHS
ncbi:hypothetical protein SCA6_020209 [Theobroma cacao]